MVETYLVKRNKIYLPFEHQWRQQKKVQRYLRSCQDTYVNQDKDYYIAQFLMWKHEEQNNGLKYHKKKKCYWVHKNQL